MVWINQEIVRYLNVYNSFKNEKNIFRGSFNYEKLQEVRGSLNYLEKKLIPLFEKEHSDLKDYAVKSGFGLENFMDCFFEARIKYLNSHISEIVSNADMYLYRISYVRDIMNKELEVGSKDN